MIKVDDLMYDFLEFPLEMNSFYEDPDVITYLEEIKKYKRFNKEEQIKLLENGEYDKVFHSNLLLAATIAERFSLLTKSIYPMDLIQEANIALLETIKKYKSKTKTDFIHYLRDSIRAKLISMLRNEGKMFEISNEDFEKIASYEKILELEKSIDSEKYYDELAVLWEQFTENCYGYDHSSYNKMLDDLPLLKSAIDGVISLDTINDNEVLGTANMEDDINDMFDKMLLIGILNKIKLSDNERVILNLLYFSERKYSEMEIAKKLNLSRPKINQMKRFLLLRIKRIFEYQSKIDTLHNKKIIK